MIDRLIIYLYIYYHFYWEISLALVRPVSNVQVAYIFIAFFIANVKLG